MNKEKYLLIIKVVVIGVNKSESQCNVVVSATARPFTETGNISDKRSHVSGPSPNENATSKQTTANRATYRSTGESVESTDTGHQGDVLAYVSSATSDRGVGKRGNGGGMSVGSSVDCTSRPAE